MIPIDATFAAILAESSRNGIAEILVQGPDPNNPTSQFATQLLLDGVTKVTVQRNEESTSDTIDFEIANPDGRYTPVRQALAFVGLYPTTPPTDSYPDALRVGSVFWKTAAFIGLVNRDTGTTLQALVPQGTFIMQASNGKISNGEVQQASHGYDLSYTLNFRVNANLPHTLFGNQTDPRYDPNYNLQNPSGDHKTFVCDAKLFMTALTDNIFLTADYALLFGQTAGANAVNVFVSPTGTVPASTPVSPSTYTWNPTTGTVTFTTAQSSTAVVSIDGVPQAMAPELMIKHLFEDYGNFDLTGSFLQTSNMLLPVYTGASDSVWRIGQAIAGMTAPRAMQWRLRFDEYGHVRFYEDAFSTQPTDTLVDEEDFISIDYNYSAEQIANVVVAQGTANNQQPITSIAYDVDSINWNGERDTFQIDSSLLLASRGAPSLFVKSMFDGICAATLTDKVNPILELNVETKPNLLRQVGDKVTVIEQNNNLSAPYIIKGITRTVENSRISEKLRLRRSILTTNYNMGLPAAISNPPAPGTSGSGSTSTTVGMNVNVTGKTGIIKQVTIGGITAIVNGTVFRDSNGWPIVPIVTPTAFSFQVDLDSTQNYDTVIWNMFYLETMNGLSSTDIMVLRGGSWLTGDGVVIPAATIAGGYTQTYNRTTNLTQGSGETAYLLSNMVYLAHANIMPPGYLASMCTLTYGSTTGLSGAIGLGYGASYSGSHAYWPNSKYTYGYYVIMAANANGASQVVRVPFAYIS